jgi:hypothetical protein
MDERAFFLADDYFKSLRLHPGTVHHHMINLFPVERTVRETPEVLPVLADGSRFVPQPKRRDAAGGRKAYQAWHPCYSHPKTLETAIERGKAEFRSGQLFYSLGINDGQRVQCQCDACRRTGWPETYYQFVTKVADALRQHYPPQMVGVLAYGDVGIPPTDLQLPENVLVHVAGNRKMLWESLAPALGTYEYPYGCGYVIPNLPLDVIRENMRYYHARNLQMYYGEMYPVWAFDAPKAYIISRLLWDWQQDEYDLLRRYCDRTFGAGGEPMHAYYATLAGIRRDDARPGQFTQVWNREWPFREPLQFLYCPNDLHTQLLACLERAGDCELTPRERNRLEMVEAFTEFSAVYYEMYRLKESVFFGAFDPAETLCRARALQKRKLDVFRRFEQHAEWFLGTACGADDFDDRVWPLRGLEQQLETAMATAMAAQDNPELEIDNTSDRKRTSAYRLLPLRRREHPWYKPTQHQAMVVTSADRASSFTFQGATNQVIKDAEDPRHAGKPKAQWLHALVRDLPASAGRRFVFQVELEGQAGLLRIECQGVSRTRVHPDRIEFVRSERVMAAGQAKQVLTAVVEPSRCLDRDEARAEGVEVDASMNLQLHFLWRPDTLSSSLSGTVNFYEIGK